MERERDAEKRLVNEVQKRSRLEVKRAPEELLEGPVRLEAVWVLSRSRKIRQKRERKRKTARLDTDNLIKLLKDVMADCGYWWGGAQVCREVCAKLWESVEVSRGIYIEVGRPEE